LSTARTEEGSKILTRSQAKTQHESVGFFVFKALKTCFDKQKHHNNELSSCLPIIVIIST
jgi:hypothetical protein